jgi:hypothetical protein
MTTPTSKPSRQHRRYVERHMVRSSMSKKERREFVRMRNPLKREIYNETLRLIADQFMSGQR